MELKVRCWVAALYMKQVIIKRNCLLVGKMQNISYGLNEDCLAAMSKTNEEWKCGNAQVELYTATS